MKPSPALTVMAEALSNELVSRGLAAVSQSTCEQIVDAMFKRSAQDANCRPITAQEAEDISRRSV